MHFVFVQLESGLLVHIHMIGNCELRLRIFWAGALQGTIRWLLVARIGKAPLNANPHPHNCYV